MKSLLFIAALLLGVTPEMALAAGQERGEAGQSGSTVPLSRVLAMIAQRYPGRQLNTTMGEAAGRPVYIVQWQLTNGRIVMLTVDARSGQIVGQ
ncbi:PepSY domain-containing protein [Phenylobacterium sp.]|jgi:uncharacterized membrane protein YkoI|uniref:PepSY domain-containing protein n=1 Tax=Phenylobacterium sp. TaxID=1871053 RepID=UPI002F418058